MPQPTRFFRVAVEGATCDGREIARRDIEEMAAAYNRDTYAARVNMEHIRGITADKPFKAYGDVLALKTEEIELDVAGKKTRKLALFAQIDPTDELVTINADRQKLYTSIEIHPNFAGSGKAYLMGLAVTDSPASLGTEMLKFCADKGDASPLAARKQDKTTLFSAALETHFELEPEPASGSDGLIGAATNFFRSFVPGGAQPAPTPTPTPTPTPPANDNITAFGAQVQEGFTRLTAAVTAVADEAKARLTKLEADAAALKASIETTDGGGARRPLATGGADYVRTDC